jgi:predicted cupin superfamily sugar epimerase
MLTLMPYAQWRTCAGQVPEDACRHPDDQAVLAYANDKLGEASEPWVVIEDHLRLAPRIRFLHMDLGGTFTEIVSRPALAEQLDLAPHPEGGWGDSIWSSHIRVDPENYPDTRVSATALHYVLGPSDRSRWHQLRSEELWLWQRGVPLRFLTAGDAKEPGFPDEQILGPDLTAGQRLHLVVPGGVWQAAEPLIPGEALMACVSAPGFDHADYRIL